MIFKAENIVIFKPGDIVIFKEHSSHLDSSPSPRFTRGKEYIIQEVGEDDLSINFHKLLDDKNSPKIIFTGSIELSPRYVRNETIKNILL